MPSRSRSSHSNGVINSKYHITNYSKSQAKKLGVTIKPSHNKTKKIDVIKNGKIIASIGAKGYGDFPTFMKTHGKTYARERRRLYKIRHRKDLTRKNSNGYYADKILW